jgi:4-diphosphocytidyl-2-C-methyl-D-erythritol kinase
VSPAKVNIFLEITGRRADGFHDLESVFLELDLADELTLAPREDGELTLSCAAAGVPEDETNLALRAARLLRERSGCRSGADLSLRKSIPAGAGLGGGSGNAAAALAGLNELWGCGASAGELAELAAELGSDVPFFLTGGACLCRGRGEVVEPLDGVAPLTLVLVLPEWQVGTAAAYGALRPERLGERSAAEMVASLHSGEVERVAAAAFNRLEEPVFAIEPRQALLREGLEGLGFLAVRMSGSGSACFGLPPAGGDADRLARLAAGCAGVSRALAVRAGVRQAFGRSAADRAGVE